MPKGRASRGRQPVEARATTHDDATRVHIPESGNVATMPKANAGQVRGAVTALGGCRHQQTAPCMGVGEGD